VFQFCTDVLKLDSLHWGYWEGEKPLTLESFKQAQQRYSNLLLSFMPRGVKTVLDIGCGLGDNARLLADCGYNVTCISPELNQQKFCERIKNERITFHLSTLENFEADCRYDLALMSESSNYFDKDKGFARCQKLLAGNGYILSTSLFRREASHEYPFHVEDEWLQSAFKHGFECVQRVDITEQVLPTVIFMRSVYEDTILPTVKLANSFLRISSPMKHRILDFLVTRVILRRQLKEVNSFVTHGYVANMCNLDLFRERAVYVVYLLRKSPTSNGRFEHPR
jgi:MPBQ/MSBQ methyltransferase